MIKSRKGANCPPSIGMFNEFMVKYRKFEEFLLLGMFLLF